MTEYTEDEMRLAREIADARYHSGERPGSWVIARDAALAAIRETTNKAAQYVSVYDHDVEGALYSGEHLK